MFTDLFSFLAYTLLIALLFMAVGITFHYYLEYGTSRRNRMALLAGALISYGFSAVFGLILLFRAGVAYFQLFKIHM